MKNIDDLEKKFKTRAHIAMVLDYDGTVASVEPKISSPFSSGTIFKRILENFASKSYINVTVITGREISDFRTEFGINSKEIDICGFADNEFYSEYGAPFKKKENIVDEVFGQNPDCEVIYIGDDKLLMAKTKKLGGSAIGIPPLCKEGENLVDFSVSQNSFEEFLLTVNNLYL